MTNGGRKPGRLARLRGRARGSLVLAGNVAALAAWFALAMGVLMVSLAESAESGGLDGIGAAIAIMGLFPFALTAFLLAVVAAALALPLGIAWCRSSEQPLLPGLSFAHMLIAWGMAIVFVGYEVAR